LEFHTLEWKVKKFHTSAWTVKKFHTTFHADVWNFLKRNLLLLMLMHVISYFHADVWNFLLSMLTYGISLLSMLTYGISLHTYTLEYK
jgi:hypothetical protein